MLLSLLVGALIGYVLAWFTHQQGLATLSFSQNSSRSALFIFTIVRFAVVFGVLMGILSTGKINQNYFLGAFIVANIAGTILLKTRTRR